MAIAEKATQKQLGNRTPTSLGCMLLTACSDLVSGRAIFTVLLGLSLSMSAISCPEGPSSRSCWVYHCRCQRSRVRKGRLHGPAGSITVDVSDLVPGRAVFTVLLGLSLSMSPAVTYIRRPGADTCSHSSSYSPEGM